MKTMLFAAAMALVPATSAFAATVDPTVGTFGDLASVGTDVTFGGTGIPTGASNFATYTDRVGNELILGLAITPRFSATTPVNDGAGTFDVQPGLDGGATLWNFSFYAEMIPGAGSSQTLEGIDLELLYDLDSAAGTDISDMGSIILEFPTNIVQGSQNLTFGFLSTGVPGAVTPGLNTFSPDFGEYSFLIRATGFGGGADAGVGVIADAGPVPVVPLPAGLPLLLAGLGGFAVLRRAKAKTS